MSNTHYYLYHTYGLRLPNRCKLSNWDQLYYGCRLSNRQHMSCSRRLLPAVSHQQWHHYRLSLPNRCQLSDRLELCYGRRLPNWRNLHDKYMLPLILILCDQPGMPDL